jgi:methylenetetrahydrofolate dehydrogenase (NADP+)/methenyltetrahydrofolate cyclohydrolase
MEKINRIIDCRKMASELMEDIRVEIDDLKNNGNSPKLCVVILGEDPSAMAYVRMIERSCEKVELKCDIIRMSVDTDETQLLETIDKLNNDDKVNGILVQMPLPKHIDEEKILNSIDYRKDVDGFNPINAGKLLSGQDSYVPCTPAAVAYIIDKLEIDMKGKHAVVIGRSNIVGKPAALLLLERNATVTICHSKTDNIKKHSLDADVLVVAVGKPYYLKKEMVGDGAIVIDVGINEVNGKIVGDVDFDEVKGKTSYITPVPGGVGSITIAMLIKNTLKAVKLFAREV